MANIQWKRGEYYEFRATTKIHLGAIEQDIYEDDIVEFDGQTLRYGGGEYAVPTLRAGVKAGWLVPSEDNVSRYVSKPAGVKVRPATPQTKAESDSMVFDTASEEEAVVGTLDAHQKRRKSAGRGKQTREARTPAPRETRKQAAPPPRPAPQPKYVEAAEEVDYSSASDVASDAEIERVKKADAINRARIAAAMSQEVPEPAEYDDDGDDDGYTVVSDDQDGQVVGKYNFSSGANVGAEDDPANRKSVRADKMRKPKVKPIGTKKRKTQVPAEGNTDISETLEGGATGDVSEPVTGEALTDLLPDAAQGPLPDPTDTWDKSPHWRTRIKIAVDKYGDDVEALKKIKAVETPGVIKGIDDALAQR